MPTSWDIIPNALSAGLQYLSLNWPTEHGWVNYNALQVLTYFVTVFIAAPLAIITGLRMSGAWPKKAVALNKAYPMELARALHFPVMIYFVAFTVVHVALVLATGALRNLNHMYAANDSAGFTGGASARNRSNRHLAPAASRGCGSSVHIHGCSGRARPPRRGGTTDPPQ